MEWRFIESATFKKAKDVPLILKIYVCFHSENNVQGYR